MDQKRLLNILRDPVVHWTALLLIGLVLYKVDASLTEPLYTYVFERSEEEAKWLSRGMAIIYLILAYVSSRLLARGEKKLFGIVILFFLLLNVFSFLGQGVAMELEARDPWNTFVEPDHLEETSSIASYRHFISVGLTIVLFGCAVIVDFLVARTEEEVKGAKKELSMSSLGRNLLSKITILQGEADRAENKPINLSEQKVNDRLQKLHSNLNGYMKTEHQLRGEQNYQLQLLEIMQKQTLHAIERVYKSKKSILQRIFG